MKPKKENGLTIIQMMTILLIVGIIGYYVVDYVIDKRCESTPDTSLCANRN